MPVYNILLMGASYGSLLASKLLFGGHSIHLVCLPAEAELINAEGFKVTLPVRGRKEPVVLESRKLPGKVTAGPATGVDPSKFDLVGLCMQEPQYRSDGVRQLLDAVETRNQPKTEAFPTYLFFIVQESIPPTKNPRGRERSVRLGMVSQRVDSLFPQLACRRAL